MNSFYSELEKKSPEAFQGVMEVIRADVVEALESENFDHVWYEYGKLFSDLEFLENKYKAFDGENSKIFYLGMLNAFFNLAKTVDKEKKQEAENKLIEKHYPKLDECIDYLANNDMAYGKQIIQALNFKHRSDLSNLVSRQEKYGYIYKYTEGNRNIYSLSRKGRKYYEDKQEKNKVSNDVLSLLDVLNYQISKGSVNIFDIITEMADQKNEFASLYVKRPFTRRLMSLKLNLDRFVMVRMRNEYTSGISTNDIPYYPSNDLVENDYNSQYCLEYST